MLAASLLPTRFRGEQPTTPSTSPSWINLKLTPVLQYFTRVSSSHPIHTIVAVALIASGSYIGLLSESLFDTSFAARKADWSSLVEGARRLYVAKESDWKWQSAEGNSELAATANHLALITLVFPESLTEDALRVPPRANAVPVPENITVTTLPSTGNSLTAYSQDSAIAFAVPYDQAPDFLSYAREIPNNARRADVRETTAHGREKKLWIMKAARVETQAGDGLGRWISNRWTEFVDLLKNAEALDIVIMVLGYISMHLTFVSLFVSMRKLGSNFWLATSVLISSIFAFLFGLSVTTKLGVPINMVMLSEGLPFLVVVIGFEKNIALTRAVLSHAIQHRKPEERPGGKSKHQAKASTHSSVIQNAIQVAIKETGFGIVKDYAIEIACLAAGAASGVQGGLQQFCFLAAWILFFDCLLLFSFYSAVICVKLEINRIRRHVDMRKALEDDGISHRVAESVAWPRRSSTTIFGRHVKPSSVPTFKVLMVSGFILINVLNICSLPFRNPNSLSKVSSWARSLSGVVAPLPVDPFKVAGNGLDAILATAKSQNRDTMVTVLTPIKYELEYPSIHYNLQQPPTTVDTSFDNLGEYVVGGRMVGGILKSLEDPVLSKWMLVALVMSIALNSYLFKAARVGIRDPNLPDHPIDARELAQAQKFNETDGATLPLGEYMQTPGRTNPPTPALTDDEGEPFALKGLTLTPRTPVVSRTASELAIMLKEKRESEMTDEEIISLCLQGKIPGHALEAKLKDYTRAVKLRRRIISRTKATQDLTGLLDHSKLPYEHYNWAPVLGACCENVIGYMPIPVGVAGPLVIDGQSFFVPMATTEGVLVASTSRGCKAINSGGGAVTVVTADGMTRGPCIGFETLERAGAAKLWLDSDKGQHVMKQAFDETSRYARLQSMKTAIAGTNLYIRFKATTGDAMGMNMISKGVEHALEVMASQSGFEDMHIISLSGNYCIDKKASAINWIDGRGKGVVAEAIIPPEVVRDVLKTDVDSMVELNVSKNLIGSAMAGAVGGFNAHAANIVAAIFIATGQDPAQVVESANCITIMKNLHGSLQISVSMPSIEVGTLGGGTILGPQGAMLEMLGVRGSHPTNAGENAKRLAKIVAAAVLAGELSLCSALAAGHLVKAHMQHNRSAPPTRSTTPAPSRINTPAPSTPVGLGPTLTVPGASAGASSGLGISSGNSASGTGLSALAMTTASDSSNGVRSAAALERQKR